MHLAFGVDRMLLLLTRILNKVMSAVEVPQSSCQLIWSPPAVSLVHSFPSIFGLKSQLKIPYITSFILLIGTWSFWMNLIVSVPSHACPWGLVLTFQIHLLPIYSMLLWSLGVWEVISNSGTCWSLCRVSIVPIQCFLWFVWDTCFVGGSAPSFLLQCVF